jgi:NAD(P)-dependent dehydrogenase (short-subunit alcohol dehydrogenase family)
MPALTAQRTVIVTGGNTGLGYHCAKSLAASDQGWHIIIASRDQTKASAAVRNLINETSHRHIEALQLDLASLVSVRAFAATVAQHPAPPLGAIVCNAGISIAGGLTYTTDGFETTFGVNHLGHFLLINLLLRQITTPARIVLVSSGTHDPDTLDGRFNPPLYYNAVHLARPEESGRPPLPGIRRYSTSKLCNIFCAYELNRRLIAEGHSTAEHPITVNAYDPGPVPGTGLVRDYPATARTLWESSVFRRALNMIGLKISDVATSGKAMARLISDPALAGVSGKYFQIAQERASSQESYDIRKAAELWESSAELVKLMPDETIFQAQMAAATN